MKKVIALLLVLVLALSLSACGKKDSQAESNQNSVVEKASKKEVLSPESAADIYMSSKSIWMENPEYPPMQGYGYCLLDLDFDGILELINSVNDGSGRFSHNKYYSLNVEEQTVEEIQTAKPEEDSGLDFYYMSTETKLFKNRSDKTMFYVAADHVRAGADEGGISYNECYIRNEKIYSNELYAEYWHSDYDGGTNEKIEEYSFGGEEVSKVKYEQKMDDFLKENKDLKLEWEYVSGEEFDESDESKQKQLLLDAYQSFSYDGFSFQEVETYDITLKNTEESKENTQELQTNIPQMNKYSLVDYDGLTIGDVAKIWGDDYTLYEGLIDGGWGAIYYEDLRCPFMFCFVSQRIPTACSGNEKLAGVIAAPSAEYSNFFVANNLKITAGYSQVEKQLSGELYEDEMEGGHTFTSELENGVILHFNWTENFNMATEITAVFLRE